MIRARLFWDSVGSVRLVMMDEMMWWWYIDTKVAMANWCEDFNELLLN